MLTMRAVGSGLLQDVIARVVFVAASRYVPVMSRIQVEPAVMCWARESIGLDVAEAARRIGVSVDVLETWEDGTRSPTTRQFRTAARVYPRPTFVLMLAEPPTDFQPIRDFRRIGAQVMPYWLRAGIRRALEQLDFYHEISQHVPPATAGLPMVTTSTGVEEAAQQIRDALGIAIDTQRGWPTPEEALASWREAAYVSASSQSSSSGFR